jgi:dihydroneopterin aldolase
MMRSRIRLDGIEANGHHGANPGERDAPQLFVVDLDVVVEVGGDRIQETADYGAIVATVRDVVQRESFRLIESLAERVATEVLAVEHVVSVRAVVRKPRAAASMEVGSVSAEAVVP